MGASERPIFWPCNWPSHDSGAPSDRNHSLLSELVLRSRELCTPKLWASILRGWKYQCASRPKLICNSHRSMWENCQQWQKDWERLQPLRVARTLLLVQLYFCYSPFLALSHLSPGSGSIQKTTLWKKEQDLRLWWTFLPECHGKTHECFPGPGRKHPSQWGQPQ